MGAASVANLSSSDIMHITRKFLQPCVHISDVLTANTQSNGPMNAALCQLCDGMPPPPPTPLRVNSESLMLESNLIVLL